MVGSKLKHFLFNKFQIVSDHRRRNVAKIVKVKVIMNEVNQIKKVGLVLVNMTREVHLQACLWPFTAKVVNGQNTLVHQERSIIITVSVKCHSGRSLENGTRGEYHPKIQHIHREAVSHFDILYDSHYFNTRGPFRSSW